MAEAGKSSKDLRTTREVAIPMEQADFPGDRLRSVGSQGDGRS